MADRYEAGARTTRARLEWGNTPRTRTPREERESNQQNLGPYETCYDVSLGYGIDRVIVTP
jgi:hypothetical protein